MPALGALCRFTLPFVATGLMAQNANADNLVGSLTSPCCSHAGSLSDRPQFFVNFSDPPPISAGTDPMTPLARVVTSIGSGGDTYTANLMETAEPSGSAQGVSEADCPAFDRVPEPAPYLLLGTGLLALAGIIQKRRSSKPMN